MSAHPRHKSRRAFQQRTNLQRARAEAAGAPPSQLDEDFGAEKEWQKQEDDRIPVTVITGFLGSGKTTLLNHLLTQDHGQRLAVIENEVGEIDIDSELVAETQKLDGTDASTVMMLNNGCLCCTVRDDLIVALTALAARKDEFDRIVIETTGLASPAPIIQTFFMEPNVNSSVRLDGVLTLVDAKHVGPHLDEEKPMGEVNEALQQIAYADRLVLNKTDLVTEEEIASLERRLRSINSLATIARTQRSKVDVEYVLGVGGYDLERVENEVNPKLLQEEPAAHEHAQQEHDHEHSHDHGHEHSHSEAHDDSHDHSHEGHSHGADDHQHHHHSDDVTSVSVNIDGEMDLEMVNHWLGSLVQLRGEDMYRMKGILAIRGFPNKYIFQGVHSLFEGELGQPWKDGQPRSSRMVFIGRDLDEELLRGGFEDCRADVVDAEMAELKKQKQQQEQPAQA